MEMMKCVVKEQKGDGYVVLTQRPVPEVGDNEVLIRVKAVAICGTDVHIKHWDDYAQKRMQPPTIIGHEYAGVVAKVGKNVKSVQVGDVVNSDSHLVCGTCDLCRNGHADVCYNTVVIGVHRDGAMAEYICIPESDVNKCDPAMPMEHLALMEPLGVAVHAAMEFPIATKKVAVIGCGPIGCMGVAVAKTLGAAQVIGIELNEQRLQMALDMGADAVVNPLKEDTAAKVKELSGGLGVDFVLDFSGNAGAVTGSFDYLKPDGTVVIAGLGPKPMTLEWERLVTGGYCVKGVSGREIPKTWERMKGLFAAGLDISKVITHVLPLEEFETGLDLMETGQCGKVVLKP